MVAVWRGELRRGDEEEEVAEASEGAVAGGGWWARWAERVVCAGLGRAKVGSSRRLVRRGEPSQDENGERATR